MSLGGNRPWIGARHDGFALADLDNSCLMLDSAGRLLVSLSGSSGSGPVLAADNMTNPTAAQVLNYGFVFDGASWDRWRGTSVAGAGNVAEQLAPVAEDNTNGIYQVLPKPLAVSTYAPTLFTNFGTDPDTSVKASAGNVFSLCVHNLNVAARYAQLHNKASAPAAAEVPLLTFLVPASSMLLLGRDFFGDWGVHFSTGIAFGFSTTEGTYTAGAGADQFTQITYK